MGKSKRSFGKKVKRTIAKVVCSGLGDTHLILQSSADGVAKLEAQVAHSLTGAAKSQVIEDRHKCTADTQLMVKSGAYLVAKALSKPFKSRKREVGDEVAGAEIVNAAI